MKNFHLREYVKQKGWLRPRRTGTLTHGFYLGNRTWITGLFENHPSSSRPEMVDLTRALRHDRSSRSKLWAKRLPTRPRESRANRVH